jgi:hypothetical protein
MCRILIGSFILFTSGDMTVHTYMCYIWKITWRPTFITDDRKKYIFQNSVFEKETKTIKHVENNGTLNVRGWGKNEHKETNFPFGERTAESPPPLPPFRKLSIRFQKNLRQIHKPLSTCQMDEKLA